MKASIAELVGEILRHLEEHPRQGISETGIRSWLVSQGYNKRDIDAAIKLVGPHVAAVPQRNPGAVRQLAPYEDLKLTREARNALARLDLYELVDPYEREILLERLMQYDGEVTLEDLDYVLTSLLCSTRDVETQQTIYGVFEGNRDLLH
jgi:uncharacterized protein Smg (DUF494 family)